MNFSLSDEQRLFQESVDSFVAKEYDLDARRALVAGEDGFSRDHWARFAELGWLGLSLDEAHGGTGGLGGGTALDTVVLMEGFGRGLVPAPYLSTVVLGVLSNGITMRAVVQLLRQEGVVLGEEENSSEATVQVLSTVWARGSLELVDYAPQAAMTHQIRPVAPLRHPPIQRAKNIRVHIPKPRRRGHTRPHLVRHNNHRCR